MLTIALLHNYLAWDALLLVKHYECCSAIAESLLQHCVQIPNKHDLKEIIEGFKCCWNFPRVVGAVDGTHIPITRPSQNQSDYYNRKGYHSIIMQVVFDYRHMFLDVCIGWPGRVYDARVLSNSNLYNKACIGCLLPNWKRNIGGVEIPLLLLGDPVYTLLPWLMKPFHSIPICQDRIM